MKDVNDLFRPPQVQEEANRHPLPSALNEYSLLAVVISPWQAASQHVDKDDASECEERIKIV